MLSVVSLGPVKWKNMPGCGVPSTQSGLTDASIHRTSHCKRRLIFFRLHPQKTRHSLTFIHPGTPTASASGSCRAQADGRVEEKSSIARKRYLMSPASQRIVMLGRSLPAAVNPNHPPGPTCLCGVIESMDRQLQAIQPP